MKAKIGQIVKRGELIGSLGSTGSSTSSHLYFEVRMFGVAKNPALFLKMGDEFVLIKHQWLSGVAFWGVLGRYI